MTKNFPDLLKDMSLHIQDAQQIPSRINSEAHVYWKHCSRIVERQIQRKHLESGKRQ